MTTLIGDALLSTQKGCELDRVVTRPDLLVQTLIDAGQLPDWTECSIEAFVVHENRTRVAMWGITMEELVQRRHEIMDYISEKTLWDGGQIFRLLSNMLVHGFRAGLGNVKDDPVSELILQASRDPELSRLMVVGGAQGASRFTAKLLELRGVS